MYLINRLCLKYSDLTYTWLLKHTTLILSKKQSGSIKATNIILIDLAWM